MPEANGRWFHIFTNHIALDYAKPGIVFPIEIHDKKAYLVKTQLGEWKAFGKSCPHQGFDMRDAIVQENDIICPLHHYCFDVNSGKCINHPGSAIKVYPLKWVDGELFGYK
jgi:nitrite reductase/ring-hydroxylating ferredoxin subunit